MSNLKIGNTSFDIDNLAFKTKSEFLKIYKNLLKANDLENAWNELKKHIKVESKSKDSD